MIVQVVAGGQTGGDLGGLLAAREANVETGGWAPLGWTTENGPAPWLADFGLKEHPQPGYPPRTHANVRDSDGTLIFGWPFSRGCELTEKYAGALGKPVIKVLWPAQPTLAVAGRATEVECFWYDVSAVKDLIRSLKIRTLNVAGNRESKRPGVQQACWAFVREVLRHG